MKIKFTAGGFFGEREVEGEEGEIKEEHQKECPPAIPTPKGFPRAYRRYIPPVRSYARVGYGAIGHYRCSGVCGK